MLGWEKESGDRADTNERKQSLVSLNAEPHCPGIFRPREHSSQGKKGVPQAENRHVTLWLDSPSRLAVVTWQVPSARLLDRKIRSQGKVSFSLTMTMSPTCRTHGRQRCESKPVSGRRAPTDAITASLAGKCVDVNMAEKGRFWSKWPKPRRDQGGQRTTACLDLDA